MIIYSCFLNTQRQHHSLRLSSVLPFLMQTICFVITPSHGVFPKQLQVQINHSKTSLAGWLQVKHNALIITAHAVECGLGGPAFSRHALFWYNEFTVFLSLVTSLLLDAQMPQCSICMSIYDRFPYTHSWNSVEVWKFTWISTFLSCILGFHMLQHGCSLS